MKASGSEADVTRPSTQRVWTAWIALTVTVACLAMVSWMVRHPLPEGWDEARFVIRMHRDATIFQEEGLVAGAKAMLVHYRMREPSFRLAVLPLTAFVDARPFALRTWSLLQAMLAVGFVYLTVRLASGRIAGYLAVAVPLFSPAFRGTSVRVYTDPAIFLAVAGSMYFLARMVLDRGRRDVNVLALAGCLAFGALAKLTFALVLGPVIVAAVFASLRGRVPRLDLRHLALACGLGALAASPHYFLNLTYWLNHAADSASGRWSLQGASFLGSSGEWMGLVRGSLLGGVGTGLVLIAAAGCLGAWAGRWSFGTSPSERLLIAGGAVGAVPLLLAHWIGGSALSRLLVPALFPLAIAVGIGVDRLRTRARSADIALLLLLFAGTSVLTVGVVRSVSVLPPSWDWGRLRTVVVERVPQGPRIAYFGRGTELNVPQLEYPWALRDEPVGVTELYNPDHDAVDWEAVDAALTEVDVALTVPDYAAAGAADNRFNADFAARLRADDRFVGPEVLTFGRPGHQTEVLVFFRRRGDMP